MEHQVVQIRYCCISYKDVILVSHQTEEENYTLMVHSILRTLDYKGRNKLSCPVDSFQVHILIDNEIVYTCVTYLTSAHYIPFTFLETMKEKFCDVPSLVSRAVTAKENEFDRDFCPVIATLVYEFNIGRGDKVSRLRAQVEDVKQVMLENVEKVMERGEQLDDLLTKTEDLESHGNAFRQQAREVRTRMRCKNLQMWLIIGSSLSLILTIAILLACGVIRL